MSQHDLTIANQGFPAFRTDLNNALQALGSTQSGTTAPSPTFANQLWYDTTNNILKIRNEDNDAWISLLTLDQSADSVSQISTALAVLSAGTVSLPALTTTGDTNTGIFFPAADTIAFTEGGVESMRIDSSGNVGIGTSSPANKLHVVTNSTTATSKGLTLTNTAASTANGQAEIDFITDQVDGSTLTNKARITASLDNSNSALGYLAFSTRSTTIQERMRIDSSGNVGIGTTSPNKISGTTILSINTATAANYAGLDISTADAVRTALYANNSGSYLETRTSTPLVFGTNTTERMRITSSGNVGIGTSSPSQKLAVIGDAYVDTYLGIGVAPASTAVITADAALNARDGIRLSTNNSPASGSFISFRNLSGNVAGSITHTGTTTVAYNTSSDYRLKENIAPITGALAKVQALKPCTYTWKEDGTDGEGFIAHELQEVCPQAVTFEKDAVDADGKPKYQGVDTSFLVATLTAAIQELKAELDSVKAELQTLKGN